VNHRLIPDSVSSEEMLCVSKRPSLGALRASPSSCTAAGSAVGSLVARSLAAARFFPFFFFFAGGAALTEASAMLVSPVVCLSWEGAAPPVEPTGEAPGGVSETARSASVTEGRRPFFLRRGRGFDSKESSVDALALSLTWSAEGRGRGTERSTDALEARETPS